MKTIFKILKYTIVSIIVLFALLIGIYWKNAIPFEDLKKKYTNTASQFIEVDGLQVHFRDEGKQNDTLPIVLIHGAAASLHTWEGWVNSLKAEHRVVTLDLPAFGLTGPNKTGIYSMDYYTQFIEKFLEKRQISRCILGGNSLGGAITWQYALAYPHKVSKMILVDAAGYPMQLKSLPIGFKVATIPILRDILKNLSIRSIIKKSVLDVFVQKEKVTDALIDRYEELGLREGNRKAFYDMMKHSDLLNNDNYLKINTLNMPTLVLWGAGDELLPPSMGQHFHDDLPNDTLIVLNNLGHTPMEEDVDKTVNIVKAFLTNK